MKKKTASNVLQTKLIPELKKLRLQELELSELVKKNQLKTDMIAFRIGKLIDSELKKQKEAKQEGVVKALAKALTVTPQTVYNYIYYYRGVVDPQEIEKTGLTRKYFQSIGSAIDPARSFLSYVTWQDVIGAPVMDEYHEPDFRKIREIGKLLRDAEKYILHTLKVDLRKIPWTHSGTKEKSWIKPDYSKLPRETMAKIVIEIVKFQQNISALIGAELYEHVLSEETFKDAKITKSEFKNSAPTADTVQGIRYVRDRQRRTNEAMSFVNPQTETTLSEKFFRGNSCDVLKDPSKFPQRSIDVVITDPPYSREYYHHAHRDHLMVEHHAEETVSEQVEVIAQIAKTIIERRICKEKFMWFCFFPLKEIHKLVPPVLKAFKGTPYSHQVLIWDKTIGPKTGTTNNFTPQLEAIHYVTINRPLAKMNQKDEKMGYHSPLFSYPVQTKGALTWKPIELLKRLIHLSTYGYDQSEKASKQVILDPFGGRGSTGIAAIECNRDFRLIELDDKQYTIAHAQLSKALATKK